ncbi:hypothetical protein CPC08DRAFT_744319 [Agrocybe pediades]|nr:hypothetical protein CPC08DRAFT_744319 [Agrocybe pediades]
MSSGSSSHASKTVWTGSCLCKAVKYTVTGDPLTFRVCHCENCRKATGSAFMSNLFYNADNIRVVQGEDKLKHYADPETWNGAPITRVFCSECGSNLFLHPSSKEAVATNTRVVTMGTIDGEVPWVPKTELWPELRRKWVHGIETRKKSRKSEAKL